MCLQDLSLLFRSGLWVVPASLRTHCWRIQDWYFYDTGMGLLRYGNFEVLRKILMWYLSLHGWAVKR